MTNKKYDNLPKVQIMQTNGGNLAPSQMIIRVDNKVIFQSYDSIIAIFDYDDMSLTFGRDYKYSTTTAKYLYQFLNTFNINVYNRRELDKLVNAGGYETSYQTWTIVQDDNLR